MSRRSLLMVAVLSTLALALIGCQSKTKTETATTTDTAATPASGHTAVEDARLANFDDLDFNVFSGQEWLSVQDQDRDRDYHRYRRNAGERPHCGRGRAPRQLRRSRFQRVQRSEVGRAQ